MSVAKPANKLTPKDWEKYPVWTYDSGNEGKPGRDETWMVPVKKLPATDLMNGGCRAKAELACGQPVTLVLWGVDLNPDKMLKMLAQYRVTPMSAAEKADILSPKVPQYAIFTKGDWWHSELHAPGELIKALRLSVREVFPIKYDISSSAVGVSHAVKGKIPSPFRT